MPKVVIVFDSESGNTQKMAEAIAKGTQAIKGVRVELYKIGTRFPVRVLEEADALVFGTPTRYGNVTSQMQTFMQSLIDLKTEKRLVLKAEVGGVFGSYGWDGGWVADKLAEWMENMGIKLASEPIAMVDGDIKSGSLEKCQNLGKRIAAKLVKA